LASARAVGSGEARSGVEKYGIDDRQCGYHPNIAVWHEVPITGVRNAKAVIICITDRGSCGRGRIIDVSCSAADELDIIDSGTAMISVERQ
jgi:rare lipoprotein A